MKSGKRKISKLRAIKPKEEYTDQFPEFFFHHGIFQNRNRRSQPPRNANRYRQPSHPQHIHTHIMLILSSKRPGKVSPSKI
jgi:hypothetical protein